MMVGESQPEEISLSLRLLQEHASWRMSLLSEAAKAEAVLKNKAAA